jgi:hypothetical protein
VYVDDGDSGGFRGIQWAPAWLGAELASTISEYLALRSSEFVMNEKGPRSLSEMKQSVLMNVVYKLPGVRVFVTAAGDVQ